MLLVFSIAFTPIFVSAKHNFRRSSEGLSLEEIQLQRLELSVVEEALEQAECNNGQCQVMMAGSSLGTLAISLLMVLHNRRANPRSISLITLDTLFEGMDSKEIASFIDNIEQIKVYSSTNVWTDSIAQVLGNAENVEEILISSKSFPGHTSSGDIIRWAKEIKIRKGSLPGTFTVGETFVTNSYHLVQDPMPRSSLVKALTSGLKKVSLPALLLGAVLSPVFMERLQASEDPNTITLTQEELDTAKEDIRVANEILRDLL